MEKEIEFGFVDIMNHSYKNAKKTKTKGKLFETTLRVHQNRYSQTGNAWKVWDSAIVFSRWIYFYGKFFVGKSVHEIGSGCGLSGLTAAFFSKRVILSDYKQQIIDNLNAKKD